MEAADLISRAPDRLPMAIRALLQLRVVEQSERSVSQWGDIHFDDLRSSLQASAQCAQRIGRIRVLAICSVMNQQCMPHQDLFQEKWTNPIARLAKKEIQSI
jgi:hypothetical protein